MYFKSSPLRYAKPVGSYKIMSINGHGSRTLPLTQKYYNFKEIRKIKKF